MRSNGDQLTLEERCQIAELHRSGVSGREIAAALDRSASSISRELIRNGSRAVAIGYRPAYAEQQARARRWSGSRLEHDAALRGTVLGHLSQGWSPAQVSGRLKREHGRPVIGCETIYRFIYAQMKRSNNGGVAPLPAEGQGPARQSRREKPQSGLVDQASRADRAAPGGSPGSLPSRSLGGRLHAVQPPRPVAARAA